VGCMCVCAYVCVCVYVYVYVYCSPSVFLRLSPGEGKGYPLQYFGLESSMDCTVHGVAKRWTQLSDFHFLLTGVHLWNEWIHSYFHPFV